LQVAVGAPTVERTAKTVAVSVKFRAVESKVDTEAVHEIGTFAEAGLPVV